MKLTHASPPADEPYHRHMPERSPRADRRPADAPQHRPRASRKWLTTFASPLPRARTAALHALADMEAEVAYLYEADNKVVIRATLPHRQIRAELTELDPESTRAVVTCMRDSDVDRITSSRVIRGMEQILEPETIGSRP